MSKMSNAVKAKRKEKTEKPVVNYMGGISYQLNPLETMKMVTASSIFGEPRYYEDGLFTRSDLSEFEIDLKMNDYILPELNSFVGKNTAEIMETVIDNALRYDFKATLEYAVTLRHEFLMRLNPQIIMVRAAIMTEERKAFTAKYPGLFNKINQKVMSRSDDVIHQLNYYLFLNNGEKSKIPGILKNSWKKNIENQTRYELNKYRNAGLGLIDTIRICHAHNTDIAELMKTGKLVMPETDKKHETLHATGKSWSEILNTINMNHMALLKNLRNIFLELEQEEPNDRKRKIEILEHLKNGVKNGKQFPYRYLTALKAIRSSDIEDKATITDSLEECMDIACQNLPHLPGTNAFLSDNSGSAWGTCPSEYGSMTVAEIGNLSSVIGAVNSDYGTVFEFGNKLIAHSISKRNGILEQANNISKSKGRKVGLNTENGIWLFFKDAIENKKHYDNIFIYSDMQAGHGGLYGTTDSAREYEKAGFNCDGKYIDVAKLAQAYRNKVNPKVNIYTIQTAGYTNVLLPENGYRTNVLYGWTGKELLYADQMNKFWDEYDQSRQTDAKTNAIK